ncbi:Charged multivesicular body protein 7 [Bos mutus]|uniref:Charged multivesicular body protein 7 n=1 Tax=Bos mutus TaxID=72004 RepID=L8IKK1_9CETA|nr:Charged multivesicular body protein 7 [Bos mutus]
MGDRTQGSPILPESLKQLLNKAAEEYALGLNNKTDVQENGEGECPKHSKSPLQVAITPVISTLEAENLDRVSKGPDSLHFHVDPHRGQTGGPACTGMFLKEHNVKTDKTLREISQQSHHSVVEEVLISHKHQLKGEYSQKLTMKHVTVQKAEKLGYQIQELCDTWDEFSQTLTEPLDLPDNPQETFYINSVPNPRISEAKLEAELKEWSLSEGGFVPSSKSSKKTIGTDSLKPL